MDTLKSSPVEFVEYPLTCASLLGNTVYVHTARNVLYILNINISANNFFN